jgi:hypothetical protein
MTINISCASRRVPKWWDHLAWTPLNKRLFPKSVAPDKRAYRRSGLVDIDGNLLRCMS